MRAYITVFISLPVLYLLLFLLYCRVTGSKMKREQERRFPKAIKPKF
jgi:hypothetical protein